MSARRRCAAALLLLLAAGFGASAAIAADSPSPLTAPAEADKGLRNGREIYEQFRAGLADPNCEPGATSPRWRQHFASAPKRMSSGDDDLLPLFGYVVDVLRQAHLPTEYALIPFVESGYRPGARSAAGPAGLWQMIALTARNHDVPIRNGYDGRLSPVDSTQAAVRYLKTLHGMFAGDWRLAVMAYNAGEYRVLGALRRSGQSAQSAQPERLSGLPDITQAYVRKLHALSCLLEQADDREDWLHALDRPVPRLQAIEVPDDVQRLQQWATRSGQDAQQLQRLNPVFADGRIGRAAGTPRLLAMAATADTSLAATTPDHGTLALVTNTTEASGPARRHTVAHGENASTIAHRYGIRVGELLQRNRLGPGSLLRPGQVLLIDPLQALADGVPDEPGMP